MMDLLVHSTGFVAMVLVAVGYARTNDAQLRWTSFAGLSVFLVHMLLLGAGWTALVMGLALVMLWAGYTGLPRIARVGWALNVALLPVALALVATGHAQPADVLPVVAGITLNTGFLFASGHALTAFLVVGESLTVLNAVLVGSPYAAVANGVALAGLAWRTLGLLRAHQRAA
jgi:Bacterial inner membrane protein